MSRKARVLAFAGSSRRESFNRKLIRVVADGASAAGAEVSLIELKDYPLPLFDQDLEADQGLPENAVKLKELFKSHDALLISSPEYNSSITPLLKNVIDWVSRKSGPDDPPLSAYSGKVALLVSASPGALGGLRGLVTLRSILSNINVIVVPEQKTLSNAGGAFDEAGNLKSEADVKAFRSLGARLAEVTGKLVGAA